MDKIKKWETITESSHVVQSQEEIERTDMNVEEAKQDTNAREVNSEKQ